MIYASHVLGHAHYNAAAHKKMQYSSRVIRMRITNSQVVVFSSSSYLSSGPLYADAPVPIFEEGKSKKKEKNVHDMHFLRLTSYRHSFIGLLFTSRFIDS